MAKKYNIPDDEPQMVGESSVAYSLENMRVTDEADGWRGSDAPCHFTSDELHAVILQSLDEKKNGKVHSHADVQRMIKSKIEAWM